MTKTQTSFKNLKSVSNIIGKYTFLYKNKIYKNNVANIDKKNKGKLKTFFRLTSSKTNNPNKDDLLLTKQRTEHSQCRLFR